MAAPAQLFWPRIAGARPGRLKTAAAAKPALWPSKPRPPPVQSGTAAWGAAMRAEGLGRFELGSRTGFRLRRPPQTAAQTGNWDICDCTWSFEGLLR